MWGSPHIAIIFKEIIMVSKIDILQVLKECNYIGESQKDYIDEKEGVYYLHGDLFYFRANKKTDTFQIGIKKTFDRWANSVDNEFKFPKTNKDWERIETWMKSVLD